jgi:hypothetical protein
MHRISAILALMGGRMDITATDARELARFCALLPALRERAAAEGWPHELRTTLRQLRDGTGPVAEVLREFWLGLGLPGQQRSYQAVPGQEAAPPPSGRYGCPRQLCSRTERREPGGPRPECALFDEPLAFG